MSEEKMNNEQKSELFVDSNDNSGNEEPENLNSYKKGLAITGFVLSLVNLCCCCWWSWAALPLSIFICAIPLIFAGISLATKRGAKGLAISAVIITVVSAVVIIILHVSFHEQIEDYSKFIKDGDKYVTMWEETGEIPAEFAKYNDPKYNSVWEAMGVKNFTQFYAEVLIKAYKQQFPNGQNGNGYGSGSSSSSSSSSDESSSETSEELVDLIAIA